MKYLVNVMIFDKNGYQKEKNIRFNNLLQLQKKVEDLDLYCVNYISGATNKDKDLEIDFKWYNVIDNNRDYLLENMYETFLETMENKEMKKEVDKLDNFIKMQEMKKEKKHTGYDLEVMLYLALEIKEILYKGEHFYIDIFCEDIKKIYEDFEKHDDANMSLLDSINKYIDENKESIKERFKDAFDTF